MRLYPAIDIIKGKAVRLVQGDYDQETVYDKDPVSVALKWAEAGASFIHVVDLDGALDGHWANKKVIKAIVDAVDIPVQTGGGVRTLDDIEDRLKAGVARVILGTIAVEHPEMVAHAVAKFGPSKIVIGIDAKDGMVAIRGWEEVSNLSAHALCDRAKSVGISTVIYTDIAKDGMMAGPNIEQTKYLSDMTAMEIIASGGVSSYEDLEKLKMSGVSGVIVGKALYTGAVDLRTAIDRFEKE